jgi:hypothetical protein
MALLWSHILGRACGPETLHVYFRMLGGESDSEIADSNVPIFADENVAWLEVTMNDPSGVCVGQPIEQIEQHVL